MRGGYEIEDEISIAGAGGGGKGGGGTAYVPTEDPDSLRSTATLEVIECLCEGEIFGFAGPSVEESIYIDGTPIKAGSVENYKGVSVMVRPGTQDQSSLAVAPSMGNLAVASLVSGNPSTEVEVSLQVKNSLPIVRTITNPYVDECRVTLSIPRLLEQDKSNGDVHGASVEIAIAVQAFGEPFVNVNLGGRQVITGKASSPYQRSYRFDLRQFGNPPYNIRVSRITADSDSLALSNETHWLMYTEITRAKLRYPNSVIVRTAIDAQQLNRVPTRGYLVKGMLVQVPINYNPVTRVYTGEWNGTFKIAWTNNPAWVFYDLLSNERYGLGKEIPLELRDKWTLYTIGQYCDQMVEDGFGGTEPRFTCNLYMQSHGEAVSVMRDLASIFRGLIYWGSGGVLTTHDAPRDPSFQYVPANVLNGEFTYSGSDRTSRYTVALVAWNNPANLFKQEIEYVEDPEGMSRYGYVETAVTAIGCTSRGQAHRVGKALLLTSRLETDTVTFAAGLDTLFVSPGEVGKIIDPLRGDGAYGGRLQSATTSSVYLDREVTLVAGYTYTITLVMPDGTLREGTVSSSAGTYPAGQMVAFSPPTPETAQEHSVWTLTPDQAEPKLYRVISVSEPEDPRSAGFFQITAVQYVPEKYAMIDNDNQLEATQPSPLPFSSRIGPPSALVVSHGVYVMPDGMHRYIDLSWVQSPGPNLSHHTVRYTSPNGTIREEKVIGQTFRVVDPAVGNYTFVVYAVDIALQPSSGISQVFELPALAPIDQIGITGLELRGQANDAQFVGPDADFVWRVSALFNSYELGEEPFGAGSGSNDPWFIDYEVTILDVFGNVRRVEHVTAAEYIYSLAKNTEDGSGLPVREFIIKVQVRDIYNRLSQASILRVSNPAPTNFGAVSYFAGYQSLFVQYQRPADADYLRTRLYVSSLPGFTPGPATLVDESNDLVLQASGLTGTDYYIVLEGVDAFGPANVFTTEVHLQLDSTRRLLNSLAGAITESELHADLLTVISGGWEAAVAAEAQIRADADGFLGAQYTIKTDINGHIAGIGLISSGNQESGVTSKVVMLADQVAIGLPSAPWTATDPFLLGQYCRPSEAYVDTYGNPGVIYRCTSDPSGVTGVTEPDWVSHTVVGSTFADGSVTWQVVEIAETIPFVVGVVDGVPAVVMATTIIGDATITRAKILSLDVVDADVVNMSVSKLIGGTITATDTIRLGDDTFQLDAVNRNMVIRDTQAIPVERVKIGRLGAGDTNYGITIRDAAGNIILSSSDGLNISGLGDFAYVDQLTQSNATTFIADAAIGSAKIINLAAEKIAAGTISAQLTMSENFVVGANGAIRSANATGYNSGSGFWMGYHAASASYRFFVGSASGRKILFDGTNLTINGTLTADAVNAVNTINLAGNAVVVTGAQSISNVAAPYIGLSATNWASIGQAVVSCSSGATKAGRIFAFVTGRAAINCGNEGGGQAAHFRIIDATSGQVIKSWMNHTIVPDQNPHTFWFSLAYSFIPNDGDRLLRFEAGHSNWSNYGSGCANSYFTVHEASVAFIGAKR